MNNAQNKNKMLTENGQVVENQKVTCDLIVKSPEECITLLLTATTNEEVTSVIDGTKRIKQENGQPFAWANHVGNATWYYPLNDEWKERRDSAIRIAKQYTK